MTIQPYRILVPFPFLVALLIGYLVTAAPSLISGRWFQAAVGVACVGAFFWKAVERRRAAVAQVAGDAESGRTYAAGRRRGPRPPG